MFPYTNGYLLNSTTTSAAGTIHTATCKNTLTTASALLLKQAKYQGQGILVYLAYQFFNSYLKNASLITGANAFSNSLLVPQPTLFQLTFGMNAVQDISHIIVEKSDIPLLIALANNTADSLLVGLLLKRLGVLQMNSVSNFNPNYYNTYFDKNKRNVTYELTFTEPASFDGSGSLLPLTNDINPNNY